MSTGPFRPELIPLPRSLSSDGGENGMHDEASDTSDDDLSSVAPSADAHSDRGTPMDDASSRVPTEVGAQLHAIPPVVNSAQEPSAMSLLRQETVVRRQKMAVDEYGFYRDPSPTNHSHPSSAAIGMAQSGKQKVSVGSKEQQWLDLLSHWDKQFAKKRSKIKKLGRSGIPESLRAKAWTALAGSDKLKEPGIYERLLAEGNSPLFEVIERDISRCFPEHSMFAEEGGEGQTNLRNVLRAYAVYNPEIGYCQGMGMLAGMMLMHMPPEESFWLLVSTLEKHLKNFFTPVLLQLRMDAAVFEVLLHKTSKRLAVHLDKQEVPPLMYITQWFLTLYTTTLPWDTVLRVWDMLYCEGVKPLFRIGLAILRVNRDTLLKQCPTNAEILSLLLHLPRDKLEADHLVEASLRVKIRRADIDHLRKRISLMEIPERGTVSLLRKQRSPH
ncbi:uncharacterized protein SPPG_09430 [Spizellomyces punctatus DAOM BR117]|uniref:Rab-GAP TBC domain-containing protein n=1 Tax=Spizellomyces punctatus (strain DAOM BR117) TaxID=645134 RepID=A0A0L0HA27_SPIPD|nr:uncharacterized protein SPPG_09430 [Spizellomyces punctatus DAOM BR117]KNC97518.1 hypothetical protein SPPG_09430 [Spizellomyces punctatus DAOM BR117]|eukprot:XP_016605558.1 hypothetical protein SPPG_09430 [Spizellomyces punctatus DAOM BR117]